MRGYSLGVLVVGLMLSAAQAALAAGFEPVEEITIDPAVPVAGEPITIKASGWMSSGPVNFDHASFSRVDQQLALDLYFNVGYLTVMSDWTHSEPIGWLPAGDYGLTVRSFDQGDLVGSGQTTFSVVPEPAGLWVIGLAVIPLLRRRGR